MTTPDNPLSPKDITTQQELELYLQFELASGSGIHQTVADVINNVGRGFGGTVKLTNLCYKLRSELQEKVLAKFYDLNPFIFE